MYLFKDFIYLFLERGREGERQGEKHWLVASHTPPIQDLAHNPGVCPDWESNSDLLVCRTKPNPLSKKIFNSNFLFYWQTLKELDYPFVTWPPPWCQTIQFLSICPRWLSSCCPSTGAQREWAWVCPHGPVRGTPGAPVTSCLTQSQSRWFSQLEVMGTSLTGTGTLGWGSWYGAETQHSCVKLEGILESQLEFVGSGHREAGLLQ